MEMDRPTVENWLRTLFLGQYSESFLDNGYDELEICKQIGEQDLDAVGVFNPTHRFKILEAVRKLREEGATAVYFTVEEVLKSGECKCVVEKNRRMPTYHASKYIPQKICHSCATNSESISTCGSPPEPKAPLPELKRLPSQKLRQMLQNKLVIDGIKLYNSPYSTKDGQTGYLNGLASRYADDVQTHYQDVLQQLDVLRQQAWQQVLDGEVRGGAGAPPLMAPPPPPPPPQQQQQPDLTQSAQPIYQPGQYLPSSCLSDNDEDEIYGFGYGVYDSRVLSQQHARRQGLRSGSPSYAVPQDCAADCAPLAPISTWGGTLTWDYNGTNTLDTVVTLTCNAGMATPDTLRTEQTTVCGVGGWNVTDLRACSVCTEEPPAPAASMKNISWTQGVDEVTYECLDAFQLPWNLTSYVLPCSVIGWDTCVPECSACRDPDISVDGVVTVAMDVQRGGKAVFNCSSDALTTATELSSQELTCTETGWAGGPVLACDTCSGDPPEPGTGQNRTWSENGTLGEAAVYQCAEGLVTSDGSAAQTVTCTEDGWFGATLPCDHCLAPPDPLHSTQRSDWNASLTVAPIGSVVTYSCGDGTVVPATNSSNQTLACRADGWDGAIQHCAACLGDIPRPPNDTEARNISWGGGRFPGARVNYTCVESGRQQTVECVDFRWAPEELDPCGELIAIIGWGGTS
ncbi:uncharacterized protein LOC119102260 [Pollicipes pollicipes]|uniref:uncharacterized protein LOC119102260 n=1 Tax=Pollicipes pollicipes TaxID=41117 RepID=UPI0018853762|nr:uncharacterized protein LOC119102260 [Pollicipes pollicipes]